LENDNIFSSGSPGGLNNKKPIETARVTMVRIILKREELATRVRERKDGEGGEMILRGSRAKQRITERLKELIR
jgi:hypothetical protein